MKIVHRCDGGVHIGLGHLIRNMTLAYELKTRGHQISFVTRQMDGIAEQRLTESGFPVLTLRDQATRTEQLDALKGNDLYIVDSYEADEPFYRSARKHAKVLAFVDYELPFPMDVDLLLIPHIGAEKLNFRVPQQALQLRGPEYVLLKEEFRDLPERIIRETPTDVLVTFGGSDVQNMTRRVAEALTGFETITVHFVLGNAYSMQREEDLRAIASTARYKFHFHRNKHSLLGLMDQSDFAIAPPSTTSYELCATGTPTLGIITGENQMICASGLQSRAAIELLGWHADLSLDQIQAATSTLIRDTGRRKKLSSAARTITDGRGAIRIADTIESVVTGS